jgi:sugar-specific transcriptional regulator TrmB
MAQKSFLKEIGLTDTEAEIYSTLSSFDDLSASQLVKETNVKRTTIYHALETLEQKGLVSKRLQSGKLSYSANNPKSLERYLDSQISSLQYKKQEVVSHLSLLLREEKKKPSSFKINQSEGIQGIKNIIDEALYCHSRRWEIIAPSKNFFSEFDKPYTTYFLKTRLENGIVARSLWESTSGRRILTDAEIKSRNPRILPEAMHGKFKTVVLIFDDKVAFIPSLKEKTAALVQSAELHDSMLAIFEGLWAHSKPYKK